VGNLSEIDKYIIIMIVHCRDDIIAVYLNVTCNSLTLFIRLMSAL
jgi:hypothetical protein